METRRRDWLHKITTAIANEAAAVILDDLRIRQMTVSAKGSVEQLFRASSDLQSASAKCLKAKPNDLVASSAERS